MTNYKLLLYYIINWIVDYIFNIIEFIVHYIILQYNI